MRTPSGRIKTPLAKRQVVCVNSTELVFKPAGISCVIVYVRRLRHVFSVTLRNLHGLYRVAQKSPDCRGSTWNTCQRTSARATLYITFSGSRVGRKCLEALWSVYCVTDWRDGGVPLTRFINNPRWQLTDVISNPELAVVCAEYWYFEVGICSAGLFFKQI
jgi:hypothetical protein